MPLVEKTTMKLVPDEKGGWYWYRPPGGDWMPHWVNPKDDGNIMAWCHIEHVNQHVNDVPGEWGPEIISPEPNQKISWTMMLPAGSRIRYSSKHSRPHGNAKELDLDLSFGKKGDNLDTRKDVYFSVRISDSGEAVFSLESPK